MGGLQPFVEAIIGLAFIGGAIWAAAALLRRFARLDKTPAVLISLVGVPGLSGGTFYLWACVFSRYCGF